VLKLSGLCEQTGNANVDGDASLIGSSVIRSGLPQTLDFVRPGDVLIDWKLNSIGQKHTNFTLVGI
jgi:DNA invertase Pin-like site-specific DNA recombinase